MLLLEEVDECKAEVGSELSTDLDLVVWEVQKDGDVIKLVYVQLIWICMFS